MNPYQYAPNPFGVGGLVCGSTIRLNSKGQWINTKGRFAGAPIKLTFRLLAGKSRAQVRAIANKLGLQPFGQVDPHDRLPRKGKNTITNKGVLRLGGGHIDKYMGLPYNEPKTATDYIYGYNNIGWYKINDRNDNNLYIPTIVP